MNIEEIKTAALTVKDWSSSNKAWVQQGDEDSGQAMFGHIDEDGNDYPIAIVDADNYGHPEMSLPLATFYAAANPGAVLQLCELAQIANEVPEGCTPADARILREANHKLANDIHQAAMVLLAVALVITPKDLSAWEKPRYGYFDADGAFIELDMADINSWPKNATNPRWVGGRGDVELIRAALAPVAKALKGGADHG